MLKKLSKYMKGLWGLAAISAAGMIVEAICELALPSLANSIYQKVDTAASPESVRTAVILSGLGMLALALLGLFGGVVTMKTSANVSQRFAGCEGICTARSAIFPLRTLTSSLLRR